MLCRDFRRKLLGVSAVPMVGHVRPHKVGSNVLRQLAELSGSDVYVSLAPVVNQLGVHFHWLCVHFATLSKLVWSHRHGP